MFMDSKDKATNHIVVVRDGVAQEYWIETKMIFFQVYEDRPYKGASQRKYEMTEALKGRWRLSDNNNSIQIMSEEGSFGSKLKRIQSLN